VLPVKPSGGIASLVTAGLETIAIRVPRHRAMRALLDATSKPIAAPSANASGSISPTRAEHVRASLGGRIPLIVDDGATQQGLESTIVRQVFGTTRILRHGPVTTADVRDALGGDVEMFDDEALREPDMIEAPGQMLAHYAPRKPLRIDAPRAAEDEYMIGFGGTGGDDNLSPAGDLTVAATRLFDALHRADIAGKPRIAVAPVPAEGIGVAINDRLRRAAHSDA
jgi:L-threonylcarbamoyladenylate synthase